MPASSYRLEDLVPHRAPMLLVDEIVSFDEENLAVRAAATIRPEWSGNWAAIELMAQTAAALAGLHDRRAGYSGPPRAGFLLGTRRLELSLAAFEVGRRYDVTARNLFMDDEAASFDCAVLDGEKTVAHAILNAYRPADIEDFLSRRAAREAAAREEQDHQPERKN
ncbi:MAG: 3-hydroxylacyl-ACP dehydratase [Kiritimatiellae bacterium]|nr:3-hydroxylacyl-ACP dehydratase [Kiritimatiellia bacterium]